MARKLACSLFVVALLSVAINADLNMIYPKGSNNRLNEANRNVANANRLFDSQNNNQGGYNVNNLYYYSTSVLEVSWVAQHSCGSENANCQIIFQYMCEGQTTGAGLRDGQVTNTISPSNDAATLYGRHETAAFYNACAVRQRNMGLFLADQVNNLNGNTAIYTRQNTNGNRHGLECPEEREYYPYWQPTPWIDAAILTDDMTRCPYYLANSQNTHPKYQCVGSTTPTASSGSASSNLNVGAAYNNQAACAAAGFSWQSVPAFGVPAPDCMPAPWSRDNHQGNGINGDFNTYTWTLPTVTVASTCVARLRYNISTNDYDGWNIDWNSNGAASPVTGNPNIDMGNGVTLTLSLNTDQYGRTFQDRSSTFMIKPRPGSVGRSARIYNLNTRGMRGNIVQNFPSVEYDFHPVTLTMTVNDYVHRQSSGSSTTPAGAGNGAENTDRNNFVELMPSPCSTVPYNGYGNMPQKLASWKSVANPTGAGFAMVKKMSLLGQNSNEMDDASPYQDFGLMNYPSVNSSHAYMSTRNNDFSNRSQKGYIKIVKGNQALSKNAIIGIAVGGGAVVLAGAAGAFAYGANNEDSAIGGAVSKVKSMFGRGSGPVGYGGGAQF